MSDAVFILAGMFDLGLFESFVVLIDEKSLDFCQLLVITFSQTAVNNIYFGSYFICSLQTKIFINYSLFRPNQKYIRNLNQGLHLEKLEYILIFW